MKQGSKPPYLTGRQNYDILKLETVFRIANASGVIQNKYWYDDLGQLVREDNRATGRTYVFDYDNAGNIQYRKTYAFTTAGTATSVSTTLYSTDNYTYGNANWGDLLTAYKGTAISYDTYGSGNDNFSTGIFQDTGWADLFQMTIYMVTPKGELKKYDGKTKTDTIIANDIPFDPKHPKR